MRRSSAAAAVAVLLSLSCSHMRLEGDRLFEQNRLEEAAEAYTKYLDRHSASEGRSDRALYHLGLIYALPDSPLYDPEKADQTLQQLLDREDASLLYLRQAELVLALQIEVARLAEKSTAHETLAARLEDELAALEQEAAQASSMAGEQEERARLLATRVQQLRSEIEQLSADLEKRTEELEKIKAIDLRRIP